MILDPVIEITKEKFESYEEIRKEGLTNMFEISSVQAFSRIELSRSEIIYIMNHYNELKEKYEKIPSLSETD